jgi:hypothetical protein
VVHLVKNIIDPVLEGFSDLCFFLGVRRVEPLGDGFRISDILQRLLVLVRCRSSRVVDLLVALDLASLGGILANETVALFVLGPKLLLDIVPRGLVFAEVWNPLELLA